ncbi:hypothetical protein V5799_029161, partial [Amblyomma americanum]
MENSDFCSLLRTMGIQPPADEQEAYWRIPADMTANMLSSRITVIKKALEGDYGAPLLVLGSASDNAAAAEESDSAADVDSSAEVDATLEEAGDSCMVVRGGHSPVKSARTPKNKSKYAKAMQELLQKKRAHEDGSSDSDEVGFVRRDQRRRKKPRARGEVGSEEAAPAATAELPSRNDGSEPGASSGRLTAEPPPSTERSKKRKRATLVVDSDEEQEFSTRSQLADVDAEDDVVVVGDESATSAGDGRMANNASGGAGSRRAGKSRVVVLDDSDDSDYTVDPFGAADGGRLENGDSGSDGAAGLVIDLDGDSDVEPGDKRSKSRASSTRGGGSEASQEAVTGSGQGSVAVVEDSDDETGAPNFSGNS